MDFSVVSTAPSRFAGYQGATAKGETVAAPDGTVAPAAAPTTSQGLKQAQATQEVADRPDTRAPGELTDEEQRVVRELKARDREVRAHEQAHKTVGGRYAGAISYEYQRGPDGVDYAVGGSVPIDASPEAEPEDTIEKMRVVIKAALAPAEPSAADRSVAAAAQRTLLDAQAELAVERAAERRGEGGDTLSVSAAIEAYGQAEEDEQEPLIAITA